MMEVVAICVVVWLIGFVISVFIELIFFSAEPVDEGAWVLTWPWSLCRLIVVVLACWVIGWWQVLLPPRARERVKRFFVDEWRNLREDFL